MTTKRKPIDRRKRALHLSRDAIDAFMAADELRLHDALDLKPWDASPLDPGILQPCPYSLDHAIARSWGVVQELRRLLDAATSKAGEVSR